MKVCQLKLCYLYNKCIILKVVISSIISFFCLSSLSAQTASNVKLKIEIGVLWDWVEGRIYLSGPFLNIEPKLKTSENTTIGLRIGAARNSQKMLNADPNRVYIDNQKNNSVFSFIPTFDYYFENDHRPYLSIGIGYHFLNTSKDVFVISNSFNDPVDVKVNNQLGVLIRGGFNLHEIKAGRYDLSRFIIGLEFNYIPNANVDMSNGQTVGTILTSNIALSVGYTVGKRTS